MCTSAKARSKKNGLEFTITKHDIKIPSICPVLGIPIIVSPGTGRRPDSPSLDRIDNTKGYTKENVRVISDRANMLKSNGTVEEFEAIIRYMKEKENYG